MYILVGTASVCIATSLTVVKFLEVSFKVSVKLKGKGKINVSFLPLHYSSYVAKTLFYREGGIE